MEAARSTSAATAPSRSPLDNAEIAQVFDDIAGLLELSGESAFTSRAYRQGAATLRELPEPVAAMVLNGSDLRALPGVGKAISDKTKELVETGRLGYYERLRSEFPVGIVDLLRVRGLGPATVRRLWKRARSDDDCRAGGGGRGRETRLASQVRRQIGRPPPPTAQAPSLAPKSTPSAIRERRPGVPRQALPPKPAHSVIPAQAGIHPRPHLGLTLSQAR